MAVIMTAKSVANQSALIQLYEDSEYGYPCASVRVEVEQGNVKLLVYDNKLHNNYAGDATFQAALMTTYDTARKFPSEIVAPESLYKTEKTYEAKSESETMDAKLLGVLQALVAALPEASKTAMLKSVTTLLDEGTCPVK